MSNVNIQKGRKIIRVDARLAKVLVAHGGYMRRDMVAQPPISPPPSDQGEGAGDDEGETDQQPEGGAGQDGQQAGAAIGEGASAEHGGGLVREAMEPQAAATLNAELDAEGMAWDPGVHVATKAKTNAGLWRKKPGASTQK